MSNQNLMQILSQKKFFLWDFDGCFADTERLHYLSYAEAFKAFGHIIHEQDYYPSFTHLGDGTLREINKHNLNCSVADVSLIKNAHYLKLIQESNVKVFPEIFAIVNLLSIKHKKIAIASNSPKHELEIILQKNNLLSEIDLVLGKTDNLRKKPYPDIFLKAMELLDATSEECIVIEDTEKGLAAAKNANCPAIWIKTNYNRNLHTTEPVLAELTHLELLNIITAM